MLENKTDQELVQSMLAEAAKAQNELNCLRKDQEKITSRLKFILVLLNILVERNQD